MRSRLLVSFLPGLFAFSVVSGCYTVHQSAIARAEKAAAQGDFLTAARSYRAACQTASQDETACSQAGLFAQKASALAISTVRPACDAGELDRCLPPLLESLELVPNHPELTLLLEKASHLHLERCAQWKPGGALNTDVAGLACLQARGNQFPLPKYQALLKERVEQLASRLVELATQAENEDAAGAAAVLWSSAQCLAPGTEANLRAQQARQTFLARSAIPVVTYLGGSMAPEFAIEISNLCQRLSSKLPPWARCVEAGKEPHPPEPLHLQVDAVIQRTVETTSSETLSVRYVSGQRVIKNPDPGFKKKVTKEKNSSSVELSYTPETTTEAVYDTFTYPVKTHRWSSAFHFTVQPSTPDAPAPVRQEGVVRFEDTEHEGFAPAKISLDPLEPPPSKAYSDAFLKRLAPHVVDAVQRDGKSRGAARRTLCRESPESWSSSWVQCWAEASLWESSLGPLPNEFLQFLASSAGAPMQIQCR
jgi:hypothetical protein